MKISREDVVHVATLARLAVNDEEVEMFTEQLNSILEYADKLNSIDTTDIMPTAHVLPLKNVFREDKVGETLPTAEALANAPEAEDGMFKVPRVIE